jgi:hypothetical protein
VQRFDLDAWVAGEQGKYPCLCGCGGIIAVKRHHHARGIPQYINGHVSRVRNSMSGRREALNPHFHGGRYIDARGYVLVLAPDRDTSGRKYVFEHRLIMERALGRKLDTQEHVHHRNHDKTDNRLENLELLHPSEHSALHDLELRQRLGERLYREARRRISRRESYKEILQCHAS